MKIVTIDELVSEKILSFDLYNEAGDKIFGAGEVLTPGKLLQLRYISVMYREYFEDEEVDETDKEIIDSPIDEIEIEEDVTDAKTDSFEIEEEIIIDFGNEPEEKKPEPIVKPTIIPKEHKPPIIEIKEPKPSTKTEWSGLKDKRINTVSPLPKDLQLEVKEVCQKAVEGISTENIEENSKFFITAKETIVNDILPKLEQIPYKSQMKLIGDYDSVHSANVAILSTLLATKMGMNEKCVNDIALAAMLHDIGKIRISNEILNKKNPSSSESKMIKLHSQIGYKILRNEMDMPEKICKVALEHHEHNDGSGYPYGVSGDVISPYSQIISVCNFYDNLTSHKGPIQVKTPKEAARLMIEMGGKYFMPNVLYTFVHMSNFNDVTPIDSLV